MPDFVAGDTNSLLIVPCMNQDGEPIDLTNYFVKLRWRYLAKGPMLYWAVMTNQDQATAPGYTQYRWAAGQLIAPSIFYDAVIYELSTGRFVTQLDEVRLSIRPRAEDPGATSSESASPSGSPTSSESASPSLTHSSSPSASPSSSTSASPSAS